MRVLVVEDDPSVAAGISDGLQAQRFDVTCVESGTEALDAVAGDVPDIVLLDLGLPDIDGTDVCRRIRETSVVPIIVVSARSEEIDRVLALEMGADDFLVKPFGIRELIARMRAVMRRSGAEPATAPRTVIGSLQLDSRTRSVALDGVELHLTPTEFDLLNYLAADVGAVHKRGDILRDVWKTEWYGTSKTLDAHVAALRRKLGDPRWIEAVRGVGFRLTELR